MCMRDHLIMLPSSTKQYKMHKGLASHSIHNMWYDMAFLLCASDLHLLARTWSPSSPALHQGPWRCSMVVVHQLQLLQLLWIDPRVLTEIKDNHMAPAGCVLIDMQVVKHYKTWSFHTTYTSHLGPYHITENTPCKNKLDASTLLLHVLRGLWE